MSSVPLAPLHQVAMTLKVNFKVPEVFLREQWPMPIMLKMMATFRQPEMRAVLKVLED